MVWSPTGLRARADSRQADELLDELNPDSYAMNPELQMRVKPAFDVLPDLKPTQIVLHDSASSHGVPVNLMQPPHPSRAAN